MTVGQPLEIKEDINTAFDSYLATREDRISLSNYKKVIINETLSNIGLEGKKRLNAKELEAFKTELNSIVYLHAGLSSFISESKQVQESKESPDHFEDPSKAKDENEKYNIIARNLFRHLTRGTPLCDKDGAGHKESLLASDELIASLFKNRNPKLMEALRDEMQNIFNNALSFLQKNQPAEIEQLYQIFQNTFLDAYPFIDPDKTKTITLPQKINGNWIGVPYRIKPIDLSPQSWPLNWLMEEEDRIYAFGLESDNPDAPSHLIIPGTTYPAGQGAGLSVAYNFYPRNTVGEAHYKGNVLNWLREQKNTNRIVHAQGHSKGASCAIEYAAKYPDLIDQADGLNPTGFCGDTLDRINKIWKKLGPGRAKNIMNIYVQAGDPVFPLEKGMIDGVNIYRVIPNTDKPAMNCGVKTPLGVIPIPAFIRKAYEAHIHHFSGRDSVLMLKVNPQSVNKVKSRQVYNNIKYLLNWMRFPLEYIDFLSFLIDRKANRFYQKHKLALYIPRLLIKLARLPFSILFSVAFNGSHVLAILLGSLFSGMKLAGEGAYQSACNKPNSIPAISSPLKQLITEQNLKINAQSDVLENPTNLAQASLSSPSNEPKHRGSSVRNALR